MKPFAIASFKYGLDARREVLARQPGTLVECTNAHITQGGEIQKRKAFSLLGEIQIDSGGNVGTFAIVTTSSGLVTFGGAPPGGISILAGVTYVQLTHPAVLEGETYNAAYHQLDKVVAVASYDGKAVVAALFEDGNTFLYYDNGTLVDQSRNGLVLHGLADVSDLATQLAGQVDHITDWAGLPNVDQDGNTVNGAVIVKSPGSVYFTGVPTAHSVSGFLSERLVDVNNPGVSETKAVAGFQVTGAAGTTYKLTAPAENDGTGTAELTGGYITALASTTLTAQAIVDAVNDLTVIHGYSAIKNATDSVFIYAPATWGALANQSTNALMVLTVDGTGGTAAAGAMGTSLGTTVTPSPLSVSKRTGRVDTTVLGVATVVVAGGSGTYTYNWAEDLGPGASPSGIAISSTTVANPTFSALVHFTGAIKDITFSGTFTCTVTDTVSSAVSSVKLSVSLRAFFE